MKKKSRVRLNDLGSKVNPRCDKGREGWLLASASHRVFDTVPVLWDGRKTHEYVSPKILEVVK